MSDVVHSKEQGFTLLEMVLALVITGLLAGAISSGLAFTAKASMDSAEAAREVPQQTTAIAVVFKLLKEGNLYALRQENSSLIMRRDNREAVILKHVAAFRTDCSVPATGLPGTGTVCRVELVTNSAGGDTYVFYATPGT